MLVEFLRIVEVTKVLIPSDGYTKKNQLFVSGWNWTFEKTFDGSLGPLDIRAINEPFGNILLLPKSESVTIEIHVHVNFVSQTLYHYWCSLHKLLVSFLCLLL